MNNLLHSEQFPLIFAFDTVVHNLLKIMSNSAINSNKKIYGDDSFAKVSSEFFIVPQKTIHQAKSQCCNTPFKFNTLAFSGLCLRTTREGGCSAALPTPYKPPNPRSLIVKLSVARIS